MITALTLLFPTFAVAGLILAFVEAIVTARAVIIKDDDAIAVAGQSGFTGYQPSSGRLGPARDEYLQQPAVRNLIRQSKSARRGLYLIAIGTLFQIIGAVPSFFSHGA
jgi:hypothetical protein